MTVYVGSFFYERWSQYSGLVVAMAKSEDAFRGKCEELFTPFYCMTLQVEPYIPWASTLIPEHVHAALEKHPSEFCWHSITHTRE